MTETATERVLAFLAAWPMSGHAPDEIYRLYSHDVQHVLTKSDILGMVDELRTEVERKIREVRVECKTSKLCHSADVEVADRVFEYFAARATIEEVSGA